MPRSVLSREQLDSGRELRHERIKRVHGERVRLVAQMIDQGMASTVEIAEALGVHRVTAWRLKQEAALRE